jgi:hypothetical protein
MQLNLSGCADCNATEKIGTILKKQKAPKSMKILGTVCWLLPLIRNADIL